MAYKNEVLGVRLSEPEKKALGELAERWHMGMSEWVRLAIHTHAGELGLWPPDQDQERRQGAQA